MRRSWARSLAVVLVTVGLSGCWLAPGAGPDRTGFNPVEKALTIDNVASLAPVWSTDAPGIDSPVGLVSAEGVVVVSGYDADAVAGIDVGTGGLLWPTGSATTGATGAAGEAPSAAALIPPSPWNLPATIVDGEIHQPWQLADSRAVLRDLHTGAHIGTLSDPYLAFRGSRRMIEDVAYVEGTFYVDQYFRVDDLADPDASWGGVLSDLSRAGFLGQVSSLGAERVYSAGPGLMTDQPGDGTLAPGVRAFEPGVPSTCGPADRPLYACPVWATPIDGSGLASTPVIGPGEQTIHVVSDAGGVYALDAATGAVRWTARVAGRTSPDPPALAYGNLYVPTTTGLSVFAADGCGAPECAPSWTVETGAPVSSQPSVAGGVVYVATEAGIVAAYDADGCGSATCAPVWSVNAGQPVQISPVPVTGRLLVATADGTVTAYRPAVSSG